MRRFYLDRQTDVSGTSGTGAVVEGVQLSDGTCVVRWLTSLNSVAIYKSIEDVVAIHGHNGATNLAWHDAFPSSPPVEPSARLRHEVAAIEAGTHVPAVDDFGNQYLSAAEVRHERFLNGDDETLRAAQDDLRRSLGPRFARRGQR